MPPYETDESGVNRARASARSPPLTTAVAAPWTGSSGNAISGRRIHDLRHAGATILMTLGVPDPIVRTVTGHRSRELERYQHLTPELRALTVNPIATELFRAKRARKETGTPTGTVRGRRVTEKLEGRQPAGTKREVGGVDGTRTRGLRRDRPNPPYSAISSHHPPSPYHQ